MINKEIYQLAKNYKSFKDSIGEQVNQFVDKYISFAFSNKQLEEALSKRGWTESDIIGIGNGGFCHKNDKDKVFEFFNNLDVKKREYMSTGNNFYGALYYELGNYEYVYNQDLETVLANMSFGMGILGDFPDYKEVIKLYLDDVEA